MRFYSFQIHPKELEILVQTSKRYVPGQSYTFKEIDRQVLDIVKKYLKRYYLDLDEANFQSMTLVRDSPRSSRIPCHTIVFYLDTSGYTFVLHGNLSCSIRKNTTHTLTVNVPMK